MGLCQSELGGQQSAIIVQVPYSKPQNPPVTYPQDNGPPYNEVDSETNELYKMTLRIHNECRAKHVG